MTDTVSNDGTASEQRPVSLNSCEVQTETEIDRYLLKKRRLSIAIGGYIKIKERYGERFSGQLRTLLATNSVESLDIELIANEMPNIYDLEALEKAAMIDERNDAVALYEERIQEIEAMIDNG